MDLSTLASNAAAAPEFLLGLIITSLLILFVPWKANHKPLDALLNSADSKKDALTKTWREQKISELTFVGVAVIHSPSTVHLPPANISPVRHPRQHRHRRNRLALRRLHAGTPMDHKGGMVLEFDSRTDRDQQRDAAEPNAVPARLLRRLSPAPACHPRAGAS
jgi:hypothetical protein